jgi:LacI family transcriptional regulator
MHKNTTKALQQIEEHIRRGVFPANSFLPSERRLCDDFGIGRGALLAILKHLAATGQIKVEPGRGARVVTQTETTGLRRVLMLESSDFNFDSSLEHLKIMDGIVKAANANGIEVSLLFGESGTATERLIEHYSRGEFNGVIIIEIVTLVDINRLLRCGIPVLVANLEIDKNVPCVTVDFRAVGRTAGYEFIANGHQRIGMFSGTKESYIYKEMLAGLKGALAEDDVQILPEHIIYWDSTDESAHLLRALLQSPQRPTAFFIARDFRAAKFYEICRELKLNIPLDVSLISYDNLSWPAAVAVGLSTITEPTADIGRHAIKMLKGWLESGSVPENTKVQGQLIKRTSVKNLIRG